MDFIIFAADWAQEYDFMVTDKVIQKDIQLYMFKWQGCD